MLEPGFWVEICLVQFEGHGRTLSGVATVLAQRGIAAFEARTQISLTEQQRATVLGAVQTAAGIVQLDLAKGTLALADVNRTSPQVAQIAATAMAPVQQSIAALGVTPAGAVAMIVGKVGAQMPNLPAPIQQPTREIP